MHSSSFLTKASSLLKDHWGHSEFRPDQIAPILSLCEGRDTLAIMSTGAGKSICFQVPGLIRGGVCLVISPLIALMRDQVVSLKAKGIAADFISSDSDSRDIDRISNNAIFGGLKFLYVAPERLKSPVFLARIERIDVRTIAVDEAHCISQWGHDFRPAYREILAMRPLCPKAVWGAFTATATIDVSLDISEQLAMNPPALFRTPIRRDNLMFAVYTIGDSERMLLECARRMRGTGLVYSGTRQASIEISKRLVHVGVEAEAYHAGLSSGERQNRQKRWMEGKTQVLTCTSAFGMGIDKADVRWVFHANIPSDMESYLQEAGRAGRDGLPSTCAIFPSSSGIENAKKSLEQQYPSLQFIQAVYQGLANQGFVAIGDCPSESNPFNLGQWSTQQNTSQRLTESSLRILQKEGVIAWHENTTSDDVRVKANKALQHGLNERNSPSPSYTLGQWLLRHAKKSEEEYRFPITLLMRSTALSESQIGSALHQFDQWGWIELVKPSLTASISWKTARVRSESLTISKELLETRKLVALGKWKSMESYLAPQTCRSTAIEHYFGQEHTTPCGTCDDCRVASQPLLPRKIDVVPENGLRISEWLWHFPLIEHNRKMKELTVLRDAGKIVLQGDQMFTTKSD